MVHRKGELSKGTINREFPYQVALKVLADREQFLRHERITVTIEEQDWRTSPRGFTLFHEDAWWNVYCFAHKAEAEMFMMLFGGVWTHPGDRRGGRNWARWTPRRTPEMP